MIKLRFTIVSKKENIHHSETIEVKLIKSGSIKILNKDKKIPRPRLQSKFKVSINSFLHNFQCRIFWFLLKLIAIFSKNNNHIINNSNNIGLLVHNLDP